MGTILGMVGLTQTRPAHQESNLLSQKQSSKVEFKIFTTEMRDSNIKNMLLYYIFYVT